LEIITTVKEVDLIFNKVDVDASGLIDWNEFLELMVKIYDFSCIRREFSFDFLPVILYLERRILRKIFA